MASMQYARPSPIPKELYGIPRHYRNFWWSSSKAPSVPDASQKLSGQTPLPEQSSADLASAPVSTEALENAPSVVGAEVPAVPPEITLPDLSAAPPIPSPLQYGDLAALGLASWTPAGLCRWGMELLQVSTGMPWFWTIISATLISRVVLFPFTVRSMRSTAALAPYQDEVNALRVQMQAAQANKDMLTLQSVAMKQRMIYDKAGVSMASMALLPFVQLPVTLGMFFGVKKLCDLPLEQLHYSGISFLPDLTVADPTCILPIASAVMMNVQLSLGLKDMTAAPHMAHMINLFRVLSVVSVPLMWNLPSGVMVYVVSSVVGISIQTLLLRQPVIRRALGIPVVEAKHGVKPASIMDSVAYAKQWWKEKKEEQEAIVRAKRR
ncbi:uncharacterized protein FIBRA_06277 [Fibroporia radiculosa]|uniref:Membrane insertase YidC/Oxa/ALB C-terminal domain-containing protein n=1 Tax=Fibroporia radiculosa TaxID=599839 RepID=J4HYV2_9APHY|nr:uncharacterized protein FIBRA_06277 [Fibroporia radiculosa]CCM04117.1 predicted protein [Fibroporia radiculosa]